MTGPETTDEDPAVLKEEVEQLRAELEQIKTRRRVGARVRPVVVGVGVFVSCVLVLTAAVGVWARNSLLKTDIFAERAGGLIDEPEVQQSLGLYLSGEITTILDAQSIIEDALPDEAAILAGPLSSAVDSFVQDKVNQFVASDTFADLWKGAVEIAHGEAVAVLEGDTPLLEEGSDSIQINLLPVINGVLAEITSASPEIFGREVDLPDVTVDDLPDQARSAIEDATGATLDENFGTFTIYDDGALSQAQDGLRLTNAAVYALLVLVPVSIGATVWLSLRRRRTILQLTLGVTVAMVLIRRLSFFFQDELLDLVRVEANLGAVRVTSETFISPLQQGAYWVGITALVIAAVAALTGPYGWAVSLRRWVASTTRSLWGAVSEQAQDDTTVAWVGRNEDTLRIGGVVALGLGLLVLDLSWIGFLVLLAVIGAYELVVRQLAEQGRAVATASDEVDELVQ